MAILEIKKYPDPILRKKSKKVKKITPEIKKLAKDMIETMEKNEGIGLAAPQVGILKKLIVVQIGEKPVVFINPKIIKKSKETEVAEEGCLSLPGVWLAIKRFSKIEMKALALQNFGKQNLGGLALQNFGKQNLGGLDINGKKLQIKAVGLMARVLQHEIDHLDGILIKDKAP